MNRNNIIYLLLFFLVLNSCNYSAKNVANNSKSVANSANCTTTAVYNFFKWYKNNYELISNINFVKVDGSLPYRINNEQVTIFINFLKTSNIFSERFLDDKKEYFRNCDELYVKNHQNDGPAEGLEADLFLYSQDVSEILGRYKESKFTANMLNNMCIIEVIYNDSFDLIFTVNNKNQIESIEPALR